MRLKKQTRWVLDQNITWLQTELKTAPGSCEHAALLQLLAREQEKLKAFLAAG